MKFLNFLYVLALFCGSVYAMEETFGGSNYVDIEAPADTQKVVDDARRGFMKVEDGQVFVDAGKIPAVVEEFERTSYWAHLNPQTSKVVKIVLLTLVSAAASYTGYITGRLFITLLVGSIAGQVAANLFRDSEPWRGLFFGLVLWFGGTAFDHFVLKIPYGYGTTAVEATFWVSRAFYDFLAWLVGRSIPDGELYKVIPPIIRGGTAGLGVEIAKFNRDIENGLAATHPQPPIDFSIGNDWV